MAGAATGAKIVGVTRLALRIVSLLALWVAAVRLLVSRGGATPEEHAQAIPGDELIAGGRSSTMATTIAAPPGDVWPWLVQMGNGRAGFYSWDRLDNGGRPSAEQIHPQWQDLEQGGRIVATPDGGAWFEAARLEPERLLVLASRLDLARMRTLAPDEPDPPFSSRGAWIFLLEPRGRDATRLIVRAGGRMRPAALGRLLDLVFFDAAHWIMQRRQFELLARRAEGLRADRERAEGVERPDPLVASRG